MRFMKGFLGHTKRFIIISIYDVFDYFDFAISVIMKLRVYDCLIPTLFIILRTVAKKIHNISSSESIQM